MARMAKSGLEYFPFDIDTFQDFRIRKLIKRQGGKAVAVYTLLLCLIYKNGYYMQWDEELPFIGSELSGFGEAYISEVIKTCLTLGLFDNNLFDTEGVLTSRGIQTRYCNIQRLNKRIGRIDKYCLLNDAPSDPAEDTQTPQAVVQPPLTAPLRQPAGSSGDNKEWLDRFFAEDNGEPLRLLCKNFGLKPDDAATLRTLADAVVNEWTLSAARHYDYSDWSRHLISCMRIKAREASKKTPPKPSAPKQQQQPSDYSFNGGFGGKDI